MLLEIDRSRVVLLGVLLGALFVAHAVSYDFMSDDGFIALRYASNLARGYGLVFNPGEHVEGFSSWLWVLLIAGGESIGIDPLVFARVAGVLAGLLTIAVTLRLALRLLPAGASPAWALFGPMIVAANGTFACWAPAGLETALFSLLVTSVVATALAGPPLVFGIVSALCILTRSEGLLIVAVVALLQWRSASAFARRQSVWVVPVATLVAQLAFRWVYYGDLLPNTFYAKTGGSWAQWSRGVRYLLDYAADHEGLPLMLLPVVVGLLGVEPRLRVIAGVVAVTWASVVAVGGDGLPMYRFVLPALPLAALLQGVFLERGYRLVATRFELDGMAHRIVLTVLVGTLVYVHLRPPEMGTHYGDYLYQQQVEVPRWVRAGLWLRNNARPGDSLAAVPIGAVSYYSELRVYDMLGLTDQHIAHRVMPAMGSGMAGHEKHDGAYILSRRPTYLLLGNIDITPAPRNLAARPFIPLSNPYIAAREMDLFESEALERLYQPRSEPIGPDEYLSFYQLRNEPGAAAPPGDGDSRGLE
jgi:hypothetical protein